jgi:hypothetical protein
MRNAYELILDRSALPAVTVRRDGWQQLELLPYFARYGTASAAWGAWSAGTRNLSASILRFHLEISQAEALEQRFGRAFLLTEYRRWSLSADTITAWLRQQRPAQVRVVLDGYAQLVKRHRPGNREMVIARELWLDSLATAREWELVHLQPAGDLIARADNRFVWLGKMSRDEMRRYMDSGLPRRVDEVADFVRMPADPTPVRASRRMTPAT